MMRIVHSSLLAFLVLGLMAFTACDDSGGGTQDTVNGDTTNGDTTNGDTSTTNPPDTTNGDTSPPNCGTRECGTFAGINCGTCTGGEECTSDGRCVQPGGPMGSYCGNTATCNFDSLSYPGCLNDACESKLCPQATSATLTLKYACSQGCQIYKDADGDGVNDADAPLSDCNPSNIVSGPSGTEFRCFNYAVLTPASTAVTGACTPCVSGSGGEGCKFNVCASDADCADGEGCELFGNGADFDMRCIAKNQAGTFSGIEVSVNGMSQSCNEDPGDGPVELCEQGLCGNFGCLYNCGDDADCDTTKVYADTGCDTGAGTCKGNPATACSTDLDCSHYECSDPISLVGGYSKSWSLCQGKDCVTDAQCGGGGYCRFFWNGEGGDDAATENSCLSKNVDGVDIGEACDPDPTDNDPGAVCKNEDLCVGGYCSAHCESDADCSADKDQLCTTSELPGDFDDDGEYDFDLAVNWCTTYPGKGDDCFVAADFSDIKCGADEYCDWFQRANDANTTVDAPYVLGGVCVDEDASLLDDGALCNSGAECKHGICLGASATQSGLCSDVCKASADCPTVSLGGETSEQACLSLFLASAGTFTYPADDIYLPLCLPVGGTLEEVAAGVACTQSNERATPSFIITDPTKAPIIEWLCSPIYEAGESPTLKGVGETCDPESETVECSSGLCLTDGYCSDFCRGSVDPCNGKTSSKGALACRDLVSYPRTGAYAANSGVISICQHDRAGEDCDYDWDCTGSTCSNGKCL